MVQRFATLVLLLYVTMTSGCMRTQYVETSSCTSCGGGCVSGAGNSSTYKERSWCGLWFGQPANVQP